MSRNYPLSAQKRDRAGKGVARALRRVSSIPAVIYGDNKEPELVSLPQKELTLTYQKGVMQTGLCELSVDGKNHLVLARDVQLHPVTDAVIHVDFLRVTPKTTITVAIPVHFIDQDSCPGIKLDKGVLTVIHHSISLICPATKIPESLEISLKDKKIGDSIRLSMATLPSGVKAPKGMEDEALATIAAPTVYADAAPPATAAAAPAAPAAKGGKAAPAAAKDAKAAAPAAPAKKK
jgi:large subunit ribosomal protein L25